MPGRTETESARLVEDVRRMSHEFNNLLTIVTGLSEVLLLQFDPAHPARPLVKEIKSAGDRATILVRELRASFGLAAAGMPTDGVAADGVAAE